MGADPRAQGGAHEEETVLENVLEYPRPAVCEPTPRRIRIVYAGETIVDTREAWRVLETYHPPTYYVPPHAVREGLLSLNGRRSLCEWKGRAVYWDARLGGRANANVAWSYPDPTPAFRPIRDFVAFYDEPISLEPGDGCFVDDERVRPQPGNFYGGWLTSDITGPVKGAPGTTHW